MSVTLEQLQALAQRLMQLEAKKDAEVAALTANLEKERGERAQEQVAHKRAWNKSVEKEKRRRRPTMRK